MNKRIKYIIKISGISALLGMTSGLAMAEYSQDNIIQYLTGNGKMMGQNLQDILTNNTLQESLTNNTLQESLTNNTLQESIAQPNMHPAVALIPIKAKTMKTIRDNLTTRMKYFKEYTKEVLKIEQKITFNINLKFQDHKNETLGFSGLYLAFQNCGMETEGKVKSFMSILEFMCGNKFLNLFTLFPDMAYEPCHYYGVNIKFESKEKITFTMSFTCPIQDKDNIDIKNTKIKYGIEIVYNPTTKKFSSIKMMDYIILNAITSTIDPIVIWENPDL